MKKILRQEQNARAKLIQMFTFIITCFGFGYGLGSMVHKVVPTEILLHIIVPAIPCSFIVVIASRFVVKRIRNNRRTNIIVSETAIHDAL